MAKAFFDMSPQDVIDEVTKSDSSDEDGAGFPAVVKMVTQVAVVRKEKRFVYCVM